MPDVDPYVGPPSEPVPADRYHRLRPWLLAAVLVLLVLALMAIGFVNGRQDPSLDIPDDVFGRDAAPVEVPEPTE